MLVHRDCQIGILHLLSAVEVTARCQAKVLLVVFGVVGAVVFENGYEVVILGAFLQSANHCVPIGFVLGS